MSSYLKKHAINPDTKFYHETQDLHKIQRVMSEKKSNNFRKKKTEELWMLLIAGKKRYIMIIILSGCAWVQACVCEHEYMERERSYCAPSCTTQSLSLGLFSICCQPSSMIKNRGGVPPSDRLQ